VTCLIMAGIALLLLPLALQLARLWRKPAPVTETTAQEKVII
jgi:putative tricarboxylic transport membrane protein